MYLIIFLPFFLSILVCAFQSPQKAFLNVYIPFLLLLPFNDYIDLPGMHTLNFAHLAIIPIFAFFIFNIYFRRAYTNWHFSLTEVLVILYVLVCVYSEKSNEISNIYGGSMALNLSVYMITGILMPYFLGKYLVFPSGIFALFSRRYVICILIVLFFCIYEWRMADSLFTKVINPFFEYQFHQPFQFRSNWTRITGPFTHPILFGIILTTAIFLNHWLTQNKYWKRNFSFFPTLPFSKGFVISCCLFIGLILTLSRAPITAFFIGSMFIGLGYARHKKISLIPRLFILGIIGIGIFAYYIQLSTQNPEGELEEAAFYRTNLLDTYSDIISEKFWFGWGTFNWATLNMDVSKGMISIDNHYLWLALKHGVIAVGIFVSLILINITRLFYQGISTKTEDKSPLAFTFFSIFCALALTISTVYMGAQVEPLFFLFLGISQAFLATKNSEINYYLKLKPGSNNDVTNQEATI